MYTRVCNLHYYFVFDSFMLRSLNCIRRMATSLISQVPDVDIDPDGVFKYILIKLSSPNEKGELTDKIIVRGYAECPYHCE